MPVKIKPPEKTEADKEIERLEEQVAKAESKGLFDTAHHEMLRRAKGAPKKDEKEIDNG